MLMPVNQGFFEIINSFDIKSITKAEEYFKGNRGGRMLTITPESHKIYTYLETEERYDIPNIFTSGTDSRHYGAFGRKREADGF